MEEGPLRGADHAPFVQPVHDVELLLATIDTVAAAPLDQQLPKLAQLEERHLGVGREVLLCLRPQRDEAWVVVSQVGEVGRHNSRSGEGTA